MNKRKRIARALQSLGILLLLSAVALAGYNQWDNDRAQKEAERQVQRIEEYRKELPEKEEPSGIPVAVPVETEEPEIPEMTEVLIDGQAYIGNLQFPTLGLDLPVISRWSYPALKIAPCRYSGSIYTDDLVIAAHNYIRHFGPVRSLPIGAEVIFTDMNGTQVRYQVAQVENMQPTEVERMEKSEYDLTLFTCIWSGSARIAVRCNRVEAGV